MRIAVVGAGVSGLVVAHLLHLAHEVTVFEANRRLPRLLGGRLVSRRPGLLRFRRRDYLGGPAVPLDRAVRELVSERTGERPEGPIRLLTHLRSFGHCFNPVSFYYCFDPAGEGVQALVAEVTNTPWGSGMPTCSVPGRGVAVRFYRLVQPLLRTPEQGADTIVWLGAAEEPRRHTGLFWHDRRPRPTHVLPWTRDTQQERQQLWAQCAQLTGWEEHTTAPDKERPNGPLPSSN